MPNYSSIPEPVAEVESLRQSVLALKQAVESLTGQRGGTSVQAATSADVTSLSNTLNNSITSLQGSIDAIDFTPYALKATTLTAGTGLSGGGDFSANITVDLEDTAVTPGTYNYATVTVDQQGRITSASSGAPGYEVRSVLKPSDTARNSSTTLTDDPHLTLSVEASTSYLVEALLFYTAGGGNIQMALTGPSGATARIIQEAGIGTTVSAAVAIGTTTGASGSNTTSGNQAVGFVGYLTVSTTAGSATVQWNRDSSSGTTTVLTGSWLRLTKVAA